ncbi:MAG: P-loop NTPase [Bacteroidales bacterium]|nr:P-loop NTPase [Bacteroidales bacterium]
MSGLICPKCGYKIDLFGVGGGKKQAEKMNIPFLGSIPINIEVRKLVDEGRSIIIEQKDADMSLAIFEIVNKIEKVFSA